MSIPPTKFQESFHTLSHPESDFLSRTKLPCPSRNYIKLLRGIQNEPDPQAGHRPVPESWQLSGSQSSGPSVPLRQWPFKDTLQATSLAIPMRRKAMTPFLDLLPLLLDCNGRWNHLLNNAHLLHKTHKNDFYLSTVW